MPQQLIDGVQTKPLRLIPDERGYLMEMLRRDDPIFRQFGQVYLSMVYPGVVKGWHYHKIQADYFVIVRGMVKVVLYDQRDESPTRGRINEFFLGDQNTTLLVIPPGVLHGMKCIGPEPALLVNIPTEPYCYDSPDEHRVDPHSKEIPYDWARKDG